MDGAISSHSETVQASALGTALDRVPSAQLIRDARKAEAERQAESQVQEADNLFRAQIAQLKADRGFAEAEAQKRIIAAQTRRAAEVAREKSTIDAQIACARAELQVQHARIEQVRLQLDADVVAPARAYKSQKEAEARAEVASIKEEGEANQRCNQENLIAQLKNGARALHFPLNTLEANGAYMVMAARAWNIKAWFALLVPTSNRWADKHESEREEVLRMEFRTFVDNFMLAPAQVLRSDGRCLSLQPLAVSDTEVSVPDDQIPRHGGSRPRRGAAPAACAPIFDPTPLPPALVLGPN